MKFTCLQENLTIGLTKVYRAVPTKSELPILANILISAQDNRLKLSATNLATTIITHVGASIDNEGSITVPAKMLRDFVSNLSSSSVDVLLKDDVLHLTSESTKSRFNGVSAEDYPDLPEGKSDLETIELNPHQFFKAVSSVYFCASTDDSRPIFTGIFIKYEANTLTLAASDGFRLAEKTIEINAKCDPFSLIIPAKTLNDVSRIFTDTDTPIKFSIDKNDNLAIFEQEDTLIATRIINGDYPDYTKIVPVDTSISAEFLTDTFAEAIKLTDIFAKESESAVMIKIDPKGEIDIFASAQEAGEHSSKIKAETTTEAAIEIGFNSKFLIDFLNNYKEEKLVISTNGNTSPCIFREPETVDYYHIIMPMQVGN